MNITLRPCLIDCQIDVFKLFLLFVVGFDFISYSLNFSVSLGLCLYAGRCFYESSVADAFFYLHAIISDSKLNKSKNRVFKCSYIITQ